MARITNTRTEPHDRRPAVTQLATSRKGAATETLADVTGLYLNQ